MYNFNQFTNSPIYSSRQSPQCPNAPISSFTHLSNSSNLLILQFPNALMPQFPHPLITQLLPISLPRQLNNPHLGKRKAILQLDLA